MAATVANNRKLILFLIFSVILIAATVFLVLSPNNAMDNAPQGMRQVKSYDANGICQAVNMPECGYCPNAPVDGKCYVKKGELEQYQ